MFMYCCVLFVKSCMLFIHCSCDVISKEGSHLGVLLCVICEGVYVVHTL